MATDHGDPELQPAESFHWVNVIDSVDFDTAPIVRGMSAKKRPAARTIAGVAYRLAFWANPDGSRVRPGLSRIAVICRVDKDTAKTVLYVLRDLGLIGVVKRGNHVRATEYQLTVPSDLHARVRVLSPTEIKARVDAVSGGGPGTSKASRGVHHPSAAGWCITPESTLSDDPSTGGMPSDQDAARGGCPVWQGGDAPLPPTKDQPQQNLTDQNLTSVSTSPEPPPPNGRDDPRRPTPEQVAALRASNRRP